MKTELKRLLLIVLLVLSVLQMTYAAQEPFRRHYIIAVDQTIQRPENEASLERIYKSLCDWLQGEMPTGLNTTNSTIPEPVKFDPVHDAVSLFAFGMAGAYHEKTNSCSGDFAKIHNVCLAGSQSAHGVFDDILNSWIKERDRFVFDNITSEPGEAFSSFLQSDLKKLFNGTDPQCQRILDESGITLSHYIYPLIMRFISKEETANEYYLIVVSDFKSGLYSNNDADDKKRLNELTAQVRNSQYADYFLSQVNDMKAPFMQADYFDFFSGPIYHNNDEYYIGAKGTRLMLKSVAQKSQLYLTSSLKVNQVSGNKFTISGARISFDKDPLTTIDSIKLIVREGDQVLWSKIIARGDDEVNGLLTQDREYEMPKQDDVDLGKQDLGEISISYILYTMSHDESGQSVLPVAISASQDIEREQITMINQQQRKMIKILICTLLALASLATLILRGRKKSLVANIGRFSQKYVNVTTDEGSVELPCWFYKEGEKSQSIHVDAKVKKRPLSIGGGTKLFVRLQDGGPNGFSYYIDEKDAADYVEIKKGKNGKYNFNVNIAMDPNKVDSSKLSTCRVMLDYKVESRLFGLFKHTDADDLGKIEFYFLNHLGNAWVGFDPGTTGSCVSYGCQSGTLDNPNIKLVKTENEEIIPSKLVLNKNFGETPVEQLTPGVDYVYGMQANRNWAAYNHQNMPCFQSIKKLLGYKNSANDMVDVKWSDGTRALTGLQLAHLLVKGLKKELDGDISRLSEGDKVRYSGKDGRARRAVVAIPNNYTLPKITDMVNSVRMLHSFDEVRYIYEAEGILFNYFRKNVKTQQPGEEIIMVYDMGGATINLSIFRIEYTEVNGTIYYNVHTLGRIGYAVGGDNIDVAIMEHLFSLKKLQNGSKSVEERHDYQLSRKIEILNKIGALKVDVVKAANSERLDGNQLQNSTTYTTAVNDILGNFASLPDDAFGDKSTSDFVRYIKDSSYMKEMVIDNVRDAVEEIMKFPLIRDLNGIDTLVFAGRSTMFPGIKETVIETIEKGFGRQVKVYNGFVGDEIKTSVAYGACWYGIYNSLVTLDNSRLSCAYGFKHTTGGESMLNVLLSQNDIFDSSGCVSNNVAFEDHFNANGNVVDFYQVMGSGVGENLFSEENRHKVNYIGSIDATTTTSEIGMSVDRRNVVTCTVRFNTGIVSRYRDLNVVGRDITKENDWAYVFAATPQTAAESRPTSSGAETRTGGRRRV